jgi:3-phosphoshikimate 1-carboxyvinyltransferase
MVSRPYVEMTVRMMKQFGVDVKNSNYLKFEVLPSRYVSPGVYYIEPDASSASYFLAATAILTGRVKIHGLGKESLQGDVYFARIMEKIGCEINIEKDFIELISNGKLEGIDIDMNSTPDLVPTVAIVALFARTPTRIRNVANLRIKESDRISALANELSKIGAKVKEYEDGLEIFPSLSYNNACVSTYNDHRIAMAFTIAGLKTGGITIENPLCVSKSFPEFFDYVEKIFY